MESENLNQFDVIIYDINGKMINKKSTINNKIKFNRENLKAGVYFYCVALKNEIVYKDKFIFK